VLGELFAVVGGQRVAKGVSDHAVGDCLNGFERNAGRDMSYRAAVALSNTSCGVLDTTLAYAGTNFPPSTNPTNAGFMSRDSKINSATKSKRPAGGRNPVLEPGREFRTMPIMLISFRFAPPQRAIGAS